MSFLAELKRRKVVRVAAVYAIVAWIVVQIAATTFPALLLPDWSVRLVIALVLLATPVVVVLAWMFDITPEGIERTERSPAGKAGPAYGPRVAPVRLPGRMPLLAVAVLGIAALGLGIYRFAPGGPGGHGEAAAPDEAIVSVAVLPFADLSQDRSQEYFGDGIAEELLNTLRSSEVSVASRTSSFAFKGSALSMRQIAGELGVSHIIEGSVRKAGDRLRISAQVIDVRSDRQLWSQTFDRPADDIFRIQDEIAAAVASALRLRLAGTERPTAGTRDAEAYDLYLLGLYHWNKRTPEGLLRALEVFTAATQRDPGYARAWAGLSLTYRNLPGYAEFDARTARREARAAAERAVQLDPLNAEARTALGGALWSNHDLAGAQREFERAIELDPTFATAYHWLGIMHTAQGRFAEGEIALRRARSLDPASLPIQSYLGLSLDMQGRVEEALAEAEDLLLRAPTYRNGLIQAFMYASLLGRAREFEHRLAGYLRAIGEDPGLARVIVDGLESPERRAAAIAAVEDVSGRRQRAGLASQQAQLFALLGARDQVIRLLATEDEPHTLLRLTVFEGMRDDPRFQAAERGHRGLEDEP
jgi:adenylate cyclase